LLLLLLLVPLASWTVSTGGLPACAGLERGASCPMKGMNANCHMACLTQAAPLSLPASMIPVVPVRLIAAGRPGPPRWPAASRSHGDMRADGYLPFVFHPPAA
jgi:hypothetical protein